MSNNDDIRIIRIEDKIDKVTAHIGDIKVTLGQQHVVLKDHIARTEALEAIVKPLHDSRQKLLGVYKLVGLMAIIGGIIEGTIILLEFLRK